MSRLDAFQFCAKALRVLGKIMILMVVAIVGLSYYAIWKCYAPMLSSRSPARALLSFLAIATFTALCAMLLWSYFTCVVADPGRVPPRWSPFADDVEAAQVVAALEQGSLDAWAAGSVHRPRYCKKCQAWKPPRAHHCSATGACVLRMDHYCVWVLNTVGLLNYKAFLLFIWYTMLAAALAGGLLLRAFIDILSVGDFEDTTTTAVLVFAWILDVAFAVALLGFLALHGRMVLVNRTTIEMFEKSQIQPWPYDHGWRRNFQEVFGRSIWRWLCPSYSDGEKRQLLAAALGQRVDDLPLAQRGPEL